jgi:hypothetical protein
VTTEGNQVNWPTQGSGQAHRVSLSLWTIIINLVHKEERKRGRRRRGCGQLRSFTAKEQQTLALRGINPFPASSLAFWVVKSWATDYQRCFHEMNSYPLPSNHPLYIDRQTDTHTHTHTHTHTEAG